MYRKPLVVEPKTSSMKAPRPSNPTQPAVKHGKVASLVKSLNSLDEQPAASWRRSPASRGLLHETPTARTAPLIPLPPRIPERKPYNSRVDNELDSSLLERRRENLVKRREKTSSLSPSVCEEWHDPSRLDNSPRRFSSEQRQGLFYGDRSPSLPFRETSPPLDRPNPFMRRDSSASPVRTSPDPSRRQSLSRKAFERVRSLSPPVLENYQAGSPGIAQNRDGSPIAAYISRKLSRHWTDAPAGKSLTPTQSSITAPPSTPLPVAHTDAPFALDLLKTIDLIISEHTAALQNVVAQSQQLLQQKSYYCPLDPYRAGHTVATPSAFHQSDKDIVTSCVSPPPTSTAEPNFDDLRAPQLLRRRTNSVPALLQLIDTAASDLGLELPKSRPDVNRRQTISNSTLKDALPMTTASPSPSPPLRSIRKIPVGPIAVTPPRITIPLLSSPLLPPPPNTRESSPPQGVQDLARSATIPTAQVLPVLQVHSPSPASSSSKSQPLITGSGEASSSSPRFHHTTSTTSPPVLEETQTRIPLPLPSLNLDYDNNKRDTYTRDTESESGSESGSGSEMHSRTIPPPPTLPSPSFIEYDRATALADRASRNSITDSTAQYTFGSTFGSMRHPGRQTRLGRQDKAAAVGRGDSTSTSTGVSTDVLVPAAAPPPTAVVEKLGKASKSEETDAGVNGEERGAGGTHSTATTTTTTEKEEEEEEEEEAGTKSAPKIPSPPPPPPGQGRGRGAIGSVRGFWATTGGSGRGWWSRGE